MRLRNGEGVLPGGPRDLPAEVFFLTYKKERPITNFISDLLNGDDLLSGNENYNVLSLLQSILQLVNNNNNNNSSSNSIVSDSIDSFSSRSREMEYRAVGGKGKNGPDVYF